MTISSGRTGFLAIPKENFLFGPSPLQKLPALTKALGGAEIWAKRDDCNSGLASGGNKIRKLEYLVHDALSKGCDTLVSIGGIQSNHTRAVTAVAVKSGLKAVTVQEQWVPIKDEDLPTYGKVGNIQLSRMMGGDVRIIEAGFGIEHKPSMKDAVASVEAAGGKPYAIPAGASDHELGGLGFVGFMLELEEQEKALGIFFDTIVVCSVTGSSHAGTIVGAAIQRDEGKPRKVIGIDASGKAAQTKAQVTKIAQNTAKLIGLGREITEDEVTLDERFHAGIYGVPDAETLAAMKMGASLEAFITDPVYEGKSLAGLIQLVKEKSIKPESKVLYIHLGGQNANNAYTTMEF